MMTMMDDVETRTPPPARTRSWIGLGDLAACDLFAVVSVDDEFGRRVMEGEEMAARGIDAEAWVVTVDGQPPAEVLAYASADVVTVGVAWGADATWREIAGPADDWAGTRWLDTPEADAQIDAAIAEMVRIDRGTGE